MAQQKMLIGHVKGDPGNPGAVTEATATVDNQVGEPSVDVQLSGENDAKKINFDFKNLKGEKGETGPTGSQGPKGNGITSIEKTAGTGDPGTKDTYTIHFDDLEDATFEVYNGQDGDGVYHVATTGSDGLMSHEDKATFDAITGGTSDSLVLADGTTKTIAAILQDNIETIRETLGVVTTEKIGLVPLLPTEDAKSVYLDEDAAWTDPNE